MSGISTAPPRFSTLKTGSPGQTIILFGTEETKKDAGVAIRCHYVRSDVIHGQAATSANQMKILKQSAAQFSLYADTHQVSQQENLAMFYCRDREVADKLLDFLKKLPGCRGLKSFNTLN